MTPEVSIIIPVFNQLCYTRGCIERLYGDPDVCRCAQVVVVDDGSTDGTREFLRSESEKRSNFRVVSFERNQGFSKACNAGAASCAGELLFLNNDTLPEPGWLPILRQSLGLPRAGVIGPKLLYPDNRTINHAGYVYGEKMGGFYPIYHRYPCDFAGVDRRRDFQALLGACLLVKKEIFDSVGGFSEFGLEDIDFCLKVRAEGLRVIYEPRAEVLHYGSVTLKNSAPNTYVQTDVHGFSARWPKHLLSADDEIYYSEDGLAISQVLNHTVHLREVVTESTALYERALSALRSGAQEEALLLLEQAVAKYLGNQWAYQELIALLLERKEIPRAMQRAEEMTKHVPNGERSVLLLADLWSRLGYAERAHAVLAELLMDWALPQELRADAEALLGRLPPA